MSDECWKKEWMRVLSDETDYLTGQSNYMLQQKSYKPGDTVMRIRIRDRRLFRIDVLKALNSSWSFRKQNCIAIKCELDDDAIIIVKKPLWDKFLFLLGIKR